MLEHSKTWDPLQNSLCESIVSNKKTYDTYGIDLLLDLYISKNKPAVIMIVLQKLLLKNGLQSLNVFWSFKLSLLGHASEASWFQSRKLPLMKTLSF